MTRMTIDSDLRSRLKDLTGPIEFCDDTGETIGVFSPTRCSESAEAMASCPYTEAELRELSQVLTGRPLTEILQDLHRK